MKGVYFCLLLLLSLITVAQDKIYLLDGQRIDGKVKEISSKTILYTNDISTLNIDVELVLLIEFSNGSTQVFNNPKKSVYKPNNFYPGSQTKMNEVLLRNELYVNTLSLFNADLSLYYEYRLSSKKTGLGFTGTYNFNQYATVPNAFIAVLNNGKKIYDAGVFVNFYTRQKPSQPYFYYGIVFKYTAFNFTSIREDSVLLNNTVSVNIHYEEASGSQFSTLFNLGIHSDLGNSMFLKSFFSLGFFALTGVYKEQLNYTLSDPQSGYNANFTILPKASLGICLGIKM